MLTFSQREFIVDLSNLEHEEPKSNEEHMQKICNYQLKMTLIDSFSQYHTKNEHSDVYTKQKKSKVSVLIQNS